MPQIRVKQDHGLPIDILKSRLDQLAQQLKEQYGISAEWISDDQAKIERTGMTGKIIFSPTEVNIELELSFILAGLRDKIEERVKRELQKALQV